MNNIKLILNSIRWDRDMITLLEELQQTNREKLLPNAVEIDHGPERMGNNWLMFIRDPDGVLYELWDVDGAVRDPHAFDGVPCVL